MVPDDVYAAAPGDARAITATGRVVYWRNPEGADPFAAGALWAGYTALDYLVGPFLSRLAESSQLLEYYVHPNGPWVPVA